MIAILILSLLHLSTAAHLRQPSASMMDLEESLDDLLYEMPEYDDPQMLEYEIAQLGSHPIMSLIHLAKKHANSKHKHVMSKEAIANLKLGLDSVITRLQTAQARLENSSTDIPVEDIEKAAEDFRKLEHIIRPDIDQLMTAMHQGLSRSEPLPHGGLLNVRSRHPPAVEVTTSESEVYEIIQVTTEAVVHEKKPSVTKAPVHQMEQPVSKPPAHQVEPSVIKPAIHEVEPPVTKHPAPEIKPPATEVPVFALPAPSTEAPMDTFQEEERRAPYKHDLFKGGMQERYEMNPYESKWTWKTASFVK